MKKLKYCLLFIYYLLLAIALYLYHDELSRIGYILLAGIMPILPSVVSKILKVKFNEFLIITYDVFVFVAMVLGNIYNFYRFLGFDKILHTASGIIIAGMVYIFYVDLKGTSTIKDRHDFMISIFFVQGVNMMCAFLWEVFEFVLLVFFNNDAIHHYDQGVYDTMTDMIVCFIGGLVVLYFIYKYYKNKKDNILTLATNEFIALNKGTD